MSHKFCNVHVVALVLAFLVALVLGYPGVQAWRDAVQLQAHGVVAQAVVDVRFHTERVVPGIRSRVEVNDSLFFRYIDAAGTPHTCRVEGRFASGTPVQSGDTVAAVYHAQNPWVCDLQARNAHYASLWNVMLDVLVGVGAAMAVVYFLAWMIRRRRQVT